MRKLTLDSTVEEIMGSPKGKRPSKRLIGLIREVLGGVSPEGEWYVDEEYHGSRVAIAYKRGDVFSGTSLLLNKEIDYWIIHWILFFTHHHDWHKPLSLGRLTIAPMDRVIPEKDIGEIAPRWESYKVWYPPLIEQQEVFKKNSLRRWRLFKRCGVFKQMKEIYNLI